MRKPITVLISVILVHILLDQVYRPWQPMFGFYDFYFSESFTQITAILGLSMVMVMVESRKPAFANLGPLFFTIVPTFAMIAYELMQLWIPFATFDPVDLIYCFIAAFLNYFVVKRILPKQN